MTMITYLAAYAGLIACICIVAFKVSKYLKRPVHIRWELYPVASEAGDRPSYGGSYLEEVDWWKHKQHHSFPNMVKGLCEEMLLMHATYKHNFPLWVRTYPMHAGLYLIIGAIFLTLFNAIFGAMLGILPGGLASFILGFTNILLWAGFLGVWVGSGALIHRRMHDKGLKVYTTREHFLNLGLLHLFGLLGLSNCLHSVITAGAADIAQNAVAFAYGMLTFNSDIGAATGFRFHLLMLWLALLLAYIPATHMAHFFMKYFMWHDIRWGDQPTRDNPKIQEQVGQALGFTPEWKANHIQGDGKKNWAEIATHNPAAPKKDAE